MALLTSQHKNILTAMKEYGKNYMKEMFYLTMHSTHFI